MEDELV